ARITGRVTDAGNGEPLPGVNIVVKGTYLGSSSDLDGRYYIVGVRPGSYDLQASFVGYKVALKTNIIVRDNEEVVVDFNMEPTVLALGQEIVIIGEKPLIDVDETATSRTIGSEDISGLAVEGINDILQQQVGVVRENNEIHIRGGRADENLYIIDNLSVKDPISGQGLGIYISADAIKELEVITGGFNAEWGQAMSGLVNVETKEGGDRFSGSLSAKWDNLAGWPEQHQNAANTEFSLGGPELLTNYLLPVAGLKLPGETTFFLNGYGFVTNTYLPKSPVGLVPRVESYDPFALREENNWSVLGKVTYKPTRIFKVSYSYGRSLRINQGYFDALVEDKEYFPLKFMNILDKYNTITRDGIQQTFNLTHTLSNRTFYELTLGNFYNQVSSQSGRKDWTEYVRPVDTEPVFYDIGPDGEVFVRAGDGLWDNGNGNLWPDHYNDTWQLKAKITSQVHPKHQIKAGLEYEQTKLQLLSIHDPWIASTDLGGDFDMYSVLTEDGALFAQDKIEFKGLIANVGLRFDWWAPGQYVEDAINDPRVITLTPQARRLFVEETDLVLGRRIKYHLSPRLGVSHPVTDRDMLFFSYGHFSQRPKGAYVYAKLKSYSPSTYQLFGNPNLNPQTTVAYEMGVKHRFSGNQVIELVAFYKDLFDYATSFKVNSVNPRLGTVSFYQYFNLDYARVRGIEVRFRARQGRYLTGNADFAYQIATGKSSSANAEIQAAANTTVQEKTLGEEFLAWDKPINASLTLWLRIPEDDRPRWLGIRWPGNWGGSLRWEVQSGKRYTPAKLVNNGQDIQDDGDRYSAISTWWNTVDLKVWKQVPLLRSMKMRFFIEAINLFNFKLPNRINPLTGEPYEYGDPAPRSWENEQGFIIIDPSRWKAPRQVYFGFSFRF
ncbi:MAG TPA: TonB-dependent receptor, partial [Bacteroidetes bacterium]|nr:TonB-dependent receptor [Bacteroidota bacterium]